jgi:predicted RNA binding protein YcfA (HicA-like mRNA interferase family)
MSPVRFAVVRKMLESAGWTFRRIKGAHHAFTKPGERTMIVPVHHNKVEPEYVKEVEKICRKGE